MAWTSYSTFDNTKGTLQFYASGDAGIVFSKNIIAVGWANGDSSSSPCLPVMTTNFNKLDHTLFISTDLNIDGSCDYPPCDVNPCEGLLAPQAFGYKTDAATTSNLLVSVFSISVLSRP